jgi:hypothetical protein
LPARYRLGAADRAGGGAVGGDSVPLTARGRIVVMNEDPRARP